jgi:ribosomal protein S18 acetylase RimI-like enzyme
MQSTLVGHVAKSSLTVEREAPASSQQEAVKDLFVNSCMQVSWHSYQKSMLLDAFSDEVQAKPPRSWVYFHRDTQLLGFCTFEIDPPNRSLYICQIAVAVGFQRQGIGTAILNHVRELTPSDCELNVITRRKNDPSLGLLNKLGFQPSDYMHPGYDPSVYVGYSILAKNTGESRAN